MTSPTLGKGFVPFLREIEKNNNREWFQSNKSRFDTDVQGPMLAFLEALQPRMRKISRHIVVDPRKTGGSLMRIHRDVRFSKDKSPYNTYVAARFRHEVGKDVDAPGFFLRVGSKVITLGCGIWQPGSPALQRIRESIDARGGAWKKAISNAAFEKRYGGLTGDSLKRPPKGYSPDHELIEDLKRKDFVGFLELPASRAVKSGLLEEITDAYGASRPLMRFLCEALDVPF